MAARPVNRRQMGVRELRDHLSEVLREVRDEDLTVDVTLHGAVVAELRPTRAAPLVGRSGPRTEEQIRADRQRWAELRRQAHLPPLPVDPEEARRREDAYDRLTRELSRGSTGTFSAVDLIRADRDAR